MAAHRSKKDFAQRRIPSVQQRRGDPDQGDDDDPAYEDHIVGDRPGTVAQVDRVSVAAGRIA